MVIPKAFVWQLSVIKISLSLAEYSHVKVGVLPAAVMPIILAKISRWNTGICKPRAIIELSLCSGCILPNSLTLTGSKYTGTESLLLLSDKCTGINLPNQLALNCQTSWNWVAKPIVIGLPNLKTLGFQASNFGLVWFGSHWVTKPIGSRLSN